MKKTGFILSALLMVVFISCDSPEAKTTDGVKVTTSASANPRVNQLVGTWNFSGMKYISSTTVLPDDLKRMNENMSQRTLSGTMLINGDSMLYVKMDPKKDPKRNKWFLSDDGQWILSIDPNNGMLDSMHIEELTDKKLRLRANEAGNVIDSEWSR